MRASQLHQFQANIGVLRYLHMYIHVVHIDLDGSIAMGLITHGRRYVVV